MGERRGVILLEVVLALTLFVGASMLVLSIFSDAIGSVQHARAQQKAVDLACSAMSMIEAGIERPRTLAGPVPAWSDSQNTEEFDDTPPDPSGWELDIETERSGFPGLTLVSITAMRVGDSGESLDASQGGASFTLQQLLRLGLSDADEVGDVDEIMEIGERNAGRDRSNRSRRRSDEGAP